MPQFPWNKLSPLCIVSDNLTRVGGWSISLSDFLPLIPNSVQKDRLNKYACVVSRPSHFLNLHGWCLSSPVTQTRVEFIRKHSWFNISFSVRLYFGGLQNHCRWWLQPWKMFTPWKESYDQPRQHIKEQRHYFANKGPSSQGYGFSSGHVWMWELDYEENWALKNCCFWTKVLEKTLESPLDSN